MQATLHEMLLAIPVLDANIAHSDRQHARIVEAILAATPRRAREAMEEHCDDTAALLRGLWDDRRRDGRMTHAQRPAT